MDSKKINIVYKNPSQYEDFKAYCKYNPDIKSHGVEIAKIIENELSKILSTSEAKKYLDKAREDIDKSELLRNKK